ncbi:hypothetical protein BJX76DRAFT_320354 [Aspergillus varians]
MGTHQDIPGEGDFDSVSGSKFSYVRDYTPSQNISLGVTDEHIITGGKRKAKPPARFIQNERDIPQSDEWKLRKRPRKAAPATPAEQKKPDTISVVIPPLDLNYDSDNSSLTQLEDLSDQMEDLASDYLLEDAEKGSPENATLGNTEAVSQEGGCPRCAGKIVDLRHRIQEDVLGKTREKRLLEQELETVQWENRRLRLELAKARKCTSSVSTRDPDEFLDQRNEIKRLRRHLSSVLEFVELTRPLPFRDDAFVLSTGFVYKEMATLGNYVAYTADSLFNIQAHDQRDKRMSSELTCLIDQTIITKDLVFSDPISAFRALVFGFVQERVFHAPEIWRDFHFDGMMTRQYQSIMEQSISPEALEQYHRASVHFTLKKNPEIKKSFFSAYADQVQSEFLNMIGPLVHLEDMGKTHLKRQTRTLFLHALNLRASCYPHNGTRYQLTQFKPGHIYDPHTMRAEDEFGAIVHVPKDRQQCRIKVCVHGLMRAHSVQENTTGLSLIKELSQPFLQEGNANGQMISDKAAVILE